MKLWYFVGEGVVERLVWMRLLGTMKGCKNLEKKFIFQIGTLNTPGINKIIWYINDSTERLPTKNRKFVTSN